MSTHAPLVIDQAPLLRAALDDCQRACRQIERLKAELHQHEAHDMPSYERWYNASFGRFLTEGRELAQAIHDRATLLAKLRERHWTNFFGGAPGVAAETYSSGGGGPAPGCSRSKAKILDDSGFEVRDADDDGSWYQAEQRYDEEGAFTYDDEESSHYDENEEAVRQFESAFGEGGGRRGGGYRGRGWAYEDRFESRARGASDAGGERESREDSPAERLKERLRERYRILARKLHPDANPDLTQEQKSLWNEVQLAYRQKNLEQLDVLIALSEAFAGRVSGSTSLHQLRRAAGEVERLIAPLRRKLEVARQHRAWGFSDLESRAGIHQEIEGQFRRELAALRRQRAELETQIARFTRPVRERMNDAGLRSP